MIKDVKFGVKGAKYATTGADTAPIAIPGLVSVTMDPTVQETIKYADNVAYYTASGTGGAKAELAFVSVPEEFKVVHAGELRTVQGGLAEVLGVVHKEPFDLIFEATGTKPRTILLRNCTVIGSIKHDYATNTENIEIADDFLSIAISGTYTADGKYLVWKEVYKSDSEHAKKINELIGLPEIGEPTPVLDPLSPDTDYE